MPTPRIATLADQFLVMVRSAMLEDRPRLTFLCRDRFGEHWEQLGAEELRRLADRIDEFTPPSAHH